MTFVFASKTLGTLYSEPRCDDRWPQPVIKAFRKRMAQISAAVDEKDLWAHKSLSFKSMKGHQGDVAIALGLQHWLVLRIDDTGHETVAVVLSIEDAS